MKERSVSSGIKYMGTGQSPINVCDVVETAVSMPRFEYAGQAMRVERVRGVPMIIFGRNGELHLGERSYRLLQLHWHTPAEHTIDDEEFAAELHLVHQDELEELLVVGIVYRLGEADEAIARVVAETPQAGDEDGVVPALSAANFAPGPGGFYHYTGSLTTPPFSEPVQWYVSRDAQTVSQRQAEQLQVLAGGPNARPLQDRNGRTILCVGCGR